jgi:hypothetical protein
MYCDLKRSGNSLHSVINISRLSIFNILSPFCSFKERFKSQYISEKNGLTLLILQVGDKLAELLKFQDTIERDTYEEEVQIAFCKFLGFDIFHF